MNVLIQVTQLFIKKIVPNFEKPPTKYMRNKGIPSKYLTAQSQQWRRVYDTFKFKYESTRTTSLTSMSLTSSGSLLI